MSHGRRCTVCYGRYLGDGNLGGCRPDCPRRQQSRRNIDRDLDAGIVAGVIHPSNPIMSTAILRAEQRIQESRHVQTRLETEIAALHSQLEANPRALDAAEQALARCLGVRATLEARHAVLVAHVQDLWP